MLPLLYISWIACLMYSYGSGVSGYITPFATMELGQSINFGAQLGMCLGLGGILCSLILGWINDKFGVKAGLLWGAITTTIGYLLMFASRGEYTSTLNINEPPINKSFPFSSSSSIAHKPFIRSLITLRPRRLNLYQLRA